MTYNATIPQSTDLISSSQPQILENFTQLNTQFSVDHTALTAVSNNGDHIQLTFPSAQTTKTATGTISYVYPKSDGTNVELYQSTYNIASAASLETKITSSGLPIWKGGTVGGSGVVTSSVTSGGYLNLPNGLQFRWGTGTVTSSGSAAAFTFLARSGAAFSTACFNVQITAQASSNSINAIVDLTTIPTASGFSARGTNSPTQFYFFAIGN